MSHIVSDHRKAVAFGAGLHRVPDVAQPVARLRRLDRPAKAFLCDVHDLLRFPRDAACGKGCRIVTGVAVDGSAYIDADNISVLDDPFFGRDSVDHLVVDGDTGTCQKTAIAQEGRSCSLRKNELVEHFIHIRCGHAWFNQLARKSQCLSADLAGKFHIG